MSVLKTSFFCLVLLGSSIALANELPANSILERYGVNPDQLPKPVDSMSVTSPQADTHTIKIKPETPWITFRFIEKKRPIETGNITIDNMNDRDLQRCVQWSEAAVEHGHKAINCGNGIATRLTW